MCKFSNFIPSSKHHVCSSITHSTIFALRSLDQDFGFYSNSGIRISFSACHSFGIMAEEFYGPSTPPQQQQQPYNGQHNGQHNGSPSYQMLQNGQHNYVLHPHVHRATHSGSMQQLPPAPHVISDWGSLGNLDSGNRSRGSGASSPAMEYHRNGTPNGFDQQAAILNGFNSLDKENMQLPNEEFTQEIEDNANAFFQRLISDENVPFEESVKELKKLKASSDKKDFSTLACIKKFFLDEYKHLLAYPESELKLMAEMYGVMFRESIIDQSDGNCYPLALKNLLNALKGSPDPSIPDPKRAYPRFAVFALGQMKTQLHQIPLFCECLMAKPANYNLLPLSVQEYVSAGAQRRLPSGVTPPTSRAIGGPVSLSINAPNMDALVRIQESNGTAVQAPPINVEEQVSFFFNNLSITELPKKVEEMREIIDRYGDSFLQWLSQQLVVYRVLGQPNFLHLYSSFVAGVSHHHAAFENYVIRETFRNIKVLLRNDKRVPIASTMLNDRQHLKTLGAWLGLLTIARNIPIKSRNLELKTLLLEASLKGDHELTCAVPFVAKLLHTCKKSQIFHSKCAWIKPIVGVLAEIHTIPSVKNNVRFEIEVLCNDLDFDLKTLKSESTYLKDVDKIKRLKPQLYEPGQNQPQYTAPEVVVPNYDGFGSSASSSPIPQSMRTDAFSSRGASPLPLNPIPSTTIPPPNVTPPVSMQSTQPPAEPSPSDQLVSKLIIYPNLAIFRHHPQLKEAIKTVYRQLVESEDFQKKIQLVCRRSVTPGVVKLIEELIRKDYVLEKDPESIRRAGAEMSNAIAAVNAQFEFKCILFPLMHKVFRDALSGVQIPSCMADEAATKLADDNVDSITNMILGNIAGNMQADVMKRISKDVECRRNGTYLPNTDHVRAYQALPVELRNNPHRNQKIYLDFAACCRLEARPYDPYHRQLNEILVNLDKVLKNYTENDLMMDRPLRSLNEIKRIVSEELQLQEPIDEKKMILIVQNATVHFIKGYDGERFSTNVYDSSDKFRSSQLLREVFVGLCKCLLIEFVQHELIQVVTNVITHAKDFPTNFEAIAFLLGQELLQANAYDQYVMKIIQAHPQAHERCAYFVQHLFRSIANNNVQNSVQNVLPECATWYAKILRMRNNGDPTRAKAEQIVKNFYDYEKTENPALLGELEQLISAHNMTEFIICSTRFVIDHTYDVLRESHSATPIYLKSLPKLLFILSEKPRETAEKLKFLGTMLEAICLAISADHEQRDYDFYGLPYDYLLKAYFKYFTETSSLCNQTEVLELFYRVFIKLQPAKATRFAFGWLNSVGSVEVLKKFMEPADPKQAQPLRTQYSKLLICQLYFLHSFLRDINVKTGAMQKLIHGTNRLMGFLLQAYPAVFYEHHHTFCEVIPSNCFHMRSLVLGASPKELQNADPYDLDSVENAELMKRDPTSPWDITKDDAFQKYKAELDNYLDNRTPVNYLTQLRNILKISNDVRGKYNASLLNIIILYVGIQAIKFHRTQNHEINFSTIGATSYMDVLQNLAVSFCSEGRYHLFNAMANQLRYPNSQTNYFSMALLYIFRESTSENVQEQIARTLYERLACHPPHPYGVRMTLAHLVSDEQYAFWSHDFANCASEISDLFQRIRYGTGQRRQQASLMQTINVADAPN
ncbi:hypothetical protein L596_025170 [Steinernema carpocapsae]|uniref:CCR4-NOT transcription complex subunit 1 n=1 Tax=Steinernema carpocapsae TaxID=34508 RepID=A0A4U5M713_STECR|nr:hypothetical protein L596_025170 [Steinernema carpocapsae]